MPCLIQISNYYNHRHYLRDHHHHNAQQHWMWQDATYHISISDNSATGRPKVGVQPYQSNHNCTQSHRHLKT